MSRNQWSYGAIQQGVPPVGKFLSHWYTSRPKLGSIFPLTMLPHCSIHTLVIFHTVCLLTEKSAQVGQSKCQVLRRQGRNCTSPTQLGHIRMGDSKLTNLLTCDVTIIHLHHVETEIQCKIIVLIFALTSTANTSCHDCATLKVNTDDADSVAKFNMFGSDRP